MRKIAFVLVLGIASSLTAQVTDKDLAKPPGSDWISYHGSYDSQRHSVLDQITHSNVSSLVSKWVYHVPGAGGLQCARCRR